MSHENHGCKYLVVTSRRSVVVGHLEAEQRAHARSNGPRTANPGPSLVEPTVRMGSTGPARTGTRLVSVTRRDPKTHWPHHHDGCSCFGYVRPVTGTGPGARISWPDRSLSTP